ncbi:MAG: FkbM family methyltransferase [Bacillota bacterium]
MQKQPQNQNRPFIFAGKYDLSYLVFPDSAIDQDVVREGVYSDWTIQLLSQFLPENSIILDIGANIGGLALPLAKMVAPQGVVYAFEPDFQNVSQLQINKELNQLDNVVVLPLVLQDDAQVAMVSLYIRRSTDQEGLVNRGLSTILWMPTDYVRKERAFSSTIDAQVWEQRITKVDLIKIDVEGAELNVLQGGHRTIAGHHPIILYEFSSVIDHMASTNNSAQAYYYLKEMGYRQYEMAKGWLLTEINKLDRDFPLVNILCFHESNLPESLKTHRLKGG